MEEKYLPIGTVVTLQGGTKRTMIVGFCPIAEDGKKYDYIGCLYPEGVISPNESLLFNHNQVATIHAKGFVDEEQTEFMTKLKEVMAKKEAESSNN